MPAAMPTAWPTRAARTTTWPATRLNFSRVRARVALSQIVRHGHRFRGLKQLNTDGADCCGDESMLCKAKECAAARRAHVWCPYVVNSQHSNRYRAGTNIR